MEKEPILRTNTAEPVGARDAATASQEWIDGIPSDSPRRKEYEAQFATAEALRERTAEIIQRAITADRAEQAQRIAELEKERDELAQWKQSAMSVYPPMQEIGKLLNLRLGDSIHDKILPGILSLRETIADLQSRVTVAEQRAEDRTAQLEQVKRERDGIELELSRSEGRRITASNDRDIAREQRDTLRTQLADLRSRLDAITQDRDMLADRYASLVATMADASEEAQRRLQEAGRLKKALREVDDYLRRIEDTRFGWDGDCGTTGLANQAKDIIDAARASTPSGDGTTEGKE